jgi:hypothetical protein
VRPAGALRTRRLRRPASGAVTRMGGDAGGDGGQLWRECAAPGATRLGPGPKGTHQKKSAVLNTVLIFGLEWRAQRKPLMLARPKRFEPSTPDSKIGEGRCLHRSFQQNGPVHRCLKINGLAAQLQNGFADRPGSSCYPVRGDYGGSGRHRFQCCVKFECHSSSGIPCLPLSRHANLHRNQLVTGKCRTEL